MRGAIMNDSRTNYLCSSITQCVYLYGYIICIYEVFRFVKDYTVSWQKLIEFFFSDWWRCYLAAKQGCHQWVSKPLTLFYHTHWALLAMMSCPTPFTIHCTMSTSPAATWVPPRHVCSLPKPLQSHPGLRDCIHCPQKKVILRPRSWSVQFYV